MNRIRSTSQIAFVIAVALLIGPYMVKLAHAAWSGNALALVLASNASNFTSQHNGSASSDNTGGRASMYYKGWVTYNPGDWQGMDGETYADLDPNDIASFYNVVSFDPSGIPNGSGARTTINGKPDGGSWEELAEDFD